MEIRPRSQQGFGMHGVSEVDPGGDLAPSRRGGKERKEQRGFAGGLWTEEFTNPPARHPSLEQGINSCQAAGQPAHRLGSRADVHLSGQGEFRKTSEGGGLA